jgi:2-phospho-L-lactate/phosphoenolpyruvate guanylyltransferase
MILVPVKNLSNAKQRLSAMLDASERTKLAHAMLIDVLGAVASFGGDDVSIVTSDPFACDLAKQHRFDVIRDESNLSESDAITMATDVCLTRGVQSTLVIPGDIPLIEAEDLRVIYENAPSTGSVLVPSSDKRGSNAVLRRPAALFPLRFGNGSFMPHLAAAITTETSCLVLSLPRIGLDIDMPEDLQQLAQAAGDKRSQVLARKVLAESRAFVLSTSESPQSSARN